MQQLAKPLGQLNNDLQVAQQYAVGMETCAVFLEYIMNVSQCYSLNFGLLCPKLWSSII